MTLQEFLVDKELIAIETLPDDRLINVVIGDGALYGVVVDDVPSGVTVTRRSPVTVTDTTIAVDGLTFTIADYTML